VASPSPDEFAHAGNSQKDISTISKPKVIGVIPARMASTRMPGKPLVDIMGLPMIEHVRRRVDLCKFIDQTIVATCDQEIIDVVTSYGGIAVMTSDKHERCTERVAEAVASTDGEIIVNIQGDEPLLMPEDLSLLITPLLEEASMPCSNLIAPISVEEANDSNVVKVVFSPRNQALYFSREPIPSAKKADDLAIQFYRQLGIIAFQRSFLETFVSLPQTQLEKIESVDMMRAIEHGFKVHVVPVKSAGLGVDTPEDLEKATAAMIDDGYVSSYI
jgi:3-deoxy-manno-octulosonate cytidylyltransferase (CMP-KDO synthetase)